MSREWTELTPVVVLSKLGGGAVEKPVTSPVLCFVRGTIAQGTEGLSNLDAQERFILLPHQVPLKPCTLGPSPQSMQMPPHQILCSHELQAWPSVSCGLCSSPSSKTTHLVSSGVVPSQCTTMLLCRVLWGLAFSCAGP